MPARPPVLIVGGGIGGLATALALARRGIDSQILERREAFSEAGAGIQLGPNATRILAALGVAEHLAAHAGEPESIVVHDAARDRPLARFPLGQWLTARHGAPYWVVHRRDLQAALLAAVARQPRIGVTMGFAATAIEEDSDSVRVLAADGSVAEARALVVADGIRSAMREYVAPRARLAPAGFIAARTVLPASAVPHPAWLASTIVTLAPDGHVVHYPVRAGREIAVVVILPGRAEGEGWAAPITWGEMAPRLSAFPRSLLGTLAGAEKWRRWDLARASGIDAIARGRMALIGDAAHPILPFLAQGGALAIEDAATIAACLAGQPEDAAAAFALYSGLRHTRQQQVVAASQRNGEIYHMAGMMRLARNATLRMTPGARMMTRLDWLYGWRAPA